jgi:hypothetical protein
MRKNKGANRLSLQLCGVLANSNFPELTDYIPL